MKNKKQKLLKELWKIRNEELLKGKTIKLTKRKEKLQKILGY